MTAMSLSLFGAFAPSAETTRRSIPWQASPLAFRIQHSSGFSRVASQLIVQPVSVVQAGTLLSVLSYMLYTEPLLGLVVLFIAVPQVLIVPLRR